MPSLTYQWQRPDEGDVYDDIVGATDETITLDEFGISGGCIRLLVTLSEAGCDDIVYTVGPICIVEHGMEGIQVLVQPDGGGSSTLQIGYPTRRGGPPNDIVWVDSSSSYWVSNPETADPASLTSFGFAGIVESFDVLPGSEPGALFTDGTSQVWIANETGAGGFAISRYDTGSDTRDDYAPGQFAQDIIFADGLAWFLESDELYSVDPGTGVVTPMGIGADLNDARAMTLDLSNRIWISNYGAAHLTIWNLGSSTSTTFSVGGTKNLDMTWASGYGMFVATDINILRLVDLFGSTVYDMPLTGWYLGPWGIAWDEFGQRLWLASYSGKYVRTFDPSGATGPFDAPPLTNPPTEDVSSPEVNSAMRGVAARGSKAFVLGAMNGDGIVSVMEYT